MQTKPLERYSGKKNKLSFKIWEIDLHEKEIWEMFNLFQPHMEPGWCWRIAEHLDKSWQTTWVNEINDLSLAGLNRRYNTYWILARLLYQNGKVYRDRTFSFFQE